MTDYYSTLGVSKDASIDDIKRAYKKLAKQYHPDINKNAGAAEKFKEINEAAAVLTDPDKRSQYDQFGKTDGQQFSGFDFRDFAGGGFEDLFENIFSGFGFRTQRRGNQGRDLEVEISVSLDDVANGTTKELHLQRMITCDTCKGKGGSDFHSCGTCQGSGVVRTARRTPFGVFATTTTCKDCKGAGQKPETTCKECGGEGRLVSREPLSVKIPAGVHDGMRLRLAGEGEAGSQGAENGDLYVVVSVEEDSRFLRDGNDLLIEQSLPFATACIGGEITVETLHGKKKIEVEPGTQNNSEIRLEGQGLPELRSNHHGDLVIKVSVEVPKKISKKQAELLKEFEKEGKKKFGFF